MTTYIIILSSKYMKGHPRAGEETYFRDKFLKGQGKYLVQLTEEHGEHLLSKLHTLRNNYPLWEKRIREVQEGKAILSIREWSGTPYNSKQCIIANLDKSSGIGIQQLSIPNIKMQDWSDVTVYSEDNSYSSIPITTIARNDGLSFPDFKAWFKGNDLTQPMAIIHFTKFRY